MRKAPIFVRLLVALVLMAVLAPATSAQLGLLNGWRSKLDPLLLPRASLLTGRSRVVVRLVDTAALGSILPVLPALGATLGRALPILNGHAIELPNVSLPVLASNPLVARLSFDRAVVGALDRTGQTVGAVSVREELGYDGTGIGVAVIDSGVTEWHDDLAASAGGGQRVDLFVDLVEARVAAYDDYGHGTHVAGIIAGNGHDSGGARSGIAPGSRLVAIKALDATGKGRISDVIAALGLTVALKDLLNIRVVNLSLATGVYESYDLDPLTLAAQRVVAAGIVVVAAAGNNGRSPEGTTNYRGITAPGNAPWVLTVGASSHMGSADRSDDTIAPFSSRGPGAIDYSAKPDLVAPGVGVVSLSDPESAFYTTRSPYLVSGTVQTPQFPYLSLSGTSMSAPVVAGTVALMLQANPSLTPNQVKAILQYTAQSNSGYDALTQGAGLLNARGAVELARFFAAPTGAVHPVSADWGRRLIWGNQLVQGGWLTANANAWSLQTTWGDPRTLLGQDVEWGVTCAAADCDGQAASWVRWGATCQDRHCRDVTWGDDESQNVVWGSSCGGDDCPTPWTLPAVSHLLLGSGHGSTVVWGTDSETVVWGTTCADSSCEPVLWSTP